MQQSGALAALGWVGIGTQTVSADQDHPNTKTRPTFYTEERVENARRNVDRYDWAAAERDDAVERADAYLDRYDYDDLWNLITSPKIVRGWHVDIHNPNTWTPNRDEPWTVSKEFDGEEIVLPTNDFEAYRQSGLDDRGLFDPDLADDSLLVNERYPDRGEDWGVDAGRGWVDEDGDLTNAGGRLGAVGRYNHYYRWQEIRRIIVACRDAYLFTGDKKYARPVSILLDRTADVYPEMDTLKQMPISEMGLEIDLNTGGRGTGKILGASVDPREIREFILAYDAVFPAQEDDQELVAFLQEKTQEYPGLDDEQKSSVGTVRKHIEDGIIREMLPAAKNSQLTPTRGAPETLSVAGRVLDEPDGFTAEAIDFVFRDGEETWNPDGTPYGQWTTSGHSLLSDLVEDRFDRDGHANEAAINYNSIQQNRIRGVADYLDGYDGYDGADLYQHPQFQQAMHSHYPTVLLDRYYPKIGDAHGAGDTGISVPMENIQRGFEVYGEEILAQALYFRNGNSTDGIQGDIFDEEPVGIGDEIQDIVDEHGTLDLETTHLPGYGLSALRAGDDHKRCTWLYYGRNSNQAGATSHAHLDTLNLGILAYDLDLAPDLGYPERTGVWAKHDWTKGTISHNTVVVDDASQEAQWVGTPLHQDTTERIDLVDVEADVYAQTESYRRTTAMVQIDDKHSYVVDFFAVDGGDEHVFSFHGATTFDVHTDGLNLEAQDGGTYAGEDVPKPGFGETTEYNQEVGNGYNYLSNVERDGEPASGFTVDWDVEDHWDARGDDAEDIGLRLTMLNDADEVALADGEPPQRWGNPEAIKYLLARRSGSNIESTFTSVVEPYDGDSLIESTELVTVAADDDVDTSDVRAVKVELSTGRTDYVVYSPTVQDETLTIDDTFRFTGFFGYYAEVDDEPEHAYLCDGTKVDPVRGGRPLIQQPKGHLEGTVTDFSREFTHETEIEAAITGPTRNLDAEHAPFLYVEPETDRNGAYPIDTVVSGRGNQVRFEIGDEIGGSRSLITGFQNPEELDDGGYHYNLATDNKVVVPLSATWSSNE